MKQWPLNKAYFWETAPFFRILLPFIAGIICYDAGLRLPVSSALLLFVAAALSFAFAASRKIHQSIIFIAVHLALISCGWLLSYSQDIRNRNDWFGNQLSGAQAFAAVLKKDPQEKDRTYKLEVAVIGKLEADDLKTSKGGAFAYIYKEQKPPLLRAGDTILIPNNWQPVRNAGNPFEFDYATYCRRNNIFYQQFLSADQVVKYNSTVPSDRNFINRAHDYCIQTLEYYIKDTAALGIMQAMLIGDESNFDPELRQAYAETGIIHIVAISGSHLTVFFFLVSFLLSWIKNKKHYWIKYAVALPLIWFYVVMAGAPPSAVRAASMFSLLALGFILRKSNNSLNQLFATASILLFAEPMWLFSVGFQLSFIAVLALIVFYKPIYRLYMPTNTAAKLLWGTVAASIAAELLVGPLVIYYFHIFPVLFIIANIVAYVFMGVVLIAGMAIIMFSFVPAVASLLALASTFLTKIFNIIITVLQELNPESLRHLQLSQIETILLYGIIASLGVYFVRSLKPALFAGLATGCILVALLCYDEWAALHQERLVIYNMNRGSHIEHIKGKRHEVVFADTVTSLKRKQYALTAAHTAWRAFELNESNIRPDVLQIGGKTVLLLNDPINISAPLNVDYLVLNYPISAGDILQLQHTYQPKLIIQSGQVSRRVAEQCKTLAAASHINLHTTALDGAYIIEAL